MDNNTEINQGQQTQTQQQVATANAQAQMPQVPAQQPPEDKIIEVGSKIKDGQYVCPNCGSSQIEPNPKTGKLKCVYCACEFDGKAVENTVKDLSKLKGRVRGSGTSNIKADAKDVVTLRCGGCGAEVVIDTANAPHARCHWCRSILSINS